MMSLVFLDVDGVLNSTQNERWHIERNMSISSYKINLPDQSLLNLKQIIDSVPNCHIILSSSWRRGGTLGGDMRNITNHLAKFGMKISGTTPINGGGSITRGLEIKDYLDNFKDVYGYTPPYIILDDNIRHIVPYHKGHVVYCDPRYGLTLNEVNISISLLKKFRSC